MRRLPLLSLILFAAYFTAFSQGEIPVDLYTGTPSITIPFGSISAIDVSQPVTLSYNANSAGTHSVCGSGWTLNFSGMITREVRGLPDDISPDRKGWLREHSPEVPVSQVIHDFVPQSDTSATTYGTAEPNDFYVLDGFEDDLIDTEPDIFSFSANGISGKFVFDKTGIIRTIPYMDIRIEPITTANAFTGFIITTNDGYKYTFTNIWGGTKQILNSGGWTTPQILTTQQRLYSGSVQFITHWVLTEMRSPAGNTITYNYGGQIDVSSRLGIYDTEDVNVAMYFDNNASPSHAYDYLAKKIQELRRPGVPDVLFPSSIQSSTGAWVKFIVNMNTGMLEKVSFMDTRNSQHLRSFQFTYFEVGYESSDPTVGDRYSLNFLKSVREVSFGCDRQRPYTFSYAVNRRLDAGPEFYVTLSYLPTLARLFYQNPTVTIDDVKYPALYIYPNQPMKNRYRLKPLHGSSATVYSMEGADRGSGRVLGTLSAIEYPSGGRVSFAFQQNQYHDASENIARYVPGTRISSIQYYDGTGATVIDKTFDYRDVNGKSSGRIFRKPIYNIPAFKWQHPEYVNSNSTSYSKTYSSLSTMEERYKKLTLRTEWDIAPNDADNAIGYARVKVTRTGAGWAIHEFEIPGVYGETSNGYWQTPETLIARESSSINMANTIFPSGGTYRFPNAPNPFYDYARGLPKKVTSYSSTGQMVQKVVTTYQDLFKEGLSQPEKVYGIRYERMPLCERNETNNRIYLFSRYFLLTDATKVPQTETVTVYDASDTTKRVTETTQYYYNSSAHRLVTEVKRTAADGTIHRSKFKYPGDYTNQSSGEDAVQALNKLADKANWFMHGAPVETVNTLQKSDGSEYVTGAGVVKYKLFSSKPLPESQWQLELDAPLAVGSFTNSSVANVSGYKFVTDSRYKKVSAIEAYSTTGMPTRVMNPVTRDTTETAYGFSNTLPVIKAVNAASNQVAFSDFDHTNEFSFTMATDYRSTGRSGKYAFYPKSVLSKNNINRVAADYYIISFWLKSTEPTSFTVKLTNTTSPYSTSYATLSFTESSTGGEFKYIQKIISGLASSVKTFRVEVSTTGLSTPGSTGFSHNLLPIIDDVFFFPEGVHMESYDYQIPYGPSMVTSGTGAASHVMYDGLGREKLVRDRDLNIIKRTTYKDLDDTPLFAETRGDHWGYRNIPFTISAVVPTCMDSVSFEWDWGSGFVAGDSIATHTFTSTGWKPIKLRVSAPGYASKTLTNEIEIKPPPIEGTLCARGLSEFDATSLIYTNGYNCTDIAVQPATGRTTFKVTNLTGTEGDDAITYTWYTREVGAPAWMPTLEGGSGLEFTTAKVVTTTSSFEVSCKVTLSDGREGWIGPMPIIISHP